MRLHRAIQRRGVLPWRNATTSKHYRNSARKESACRRPVETGRIERRQGPRRQPDAETAQPHRAESGHGEVEQMTAIAGRMLRASAEDDHTTQGTLVFAGGAGGDGRSINRNSGTLATEGNGPGPHETVLQIDRLSGIGSRTMAGIASHRRQS